jgi:hypothetical protein
MEVRVRPRVSSGNVAGLMEILADPNYSSTERAGYLDPRPACDPVGITPRAPRNAGTHQAPLNAAMRLESKQDRDLTEG